MEKNEDSLQEGLVGAEEENVRRDNYQRETCSTVNERYSIHVCRTGYHKRLYIDIAIFGLNSNIEYEF